MKNQNQIRLPTTLAALTLIKILYQDNVINQKCMDKKLLEDVKQTFPFSEDLELYNNDGLDDSISYENWLRNDGK